MTEPEPTRRTHSRVWGVLGWAKWLPEAGNAVLVGLTILLSIASLVPYSDDEIRQSLVDTYEPSAWNFIGVSVLAILGVLAAVVARTASALAARRRIATIQIAVMVAAVAVAAFGHHRLMHRTTRLTGKRSFPPDTVVEVKALACELPCTLGLPLSRFSISEMKREVLNRGLVATIGDTTLWRWLSQDAIRAYSGAS